MRKGLSSLAVAFFILNCAPKPTEKVDLSKTRASFMLTDGTSISTDEYDEYSPVLIKRSDDLLALIFASDRPCGACANGQHNLFIAVSTEPYLDDLEIPAFNPPVLVRPDGAMATDSISRIRFAAEGLGSMIAIAFEYSGGISQFTLTEVNQATGTGTSLGPIGNGLRTADTLIGFGPNSGTILTRDGSGNTRYSNITQPHNGRVLTNEAFGAAESVTYLDPLQTFFNAGLFAVEDGSLMLGTLHENFGPHESFQEALDDESVSLSAASVFSAGPFGNDVLIFSGNDGTSDDLYAVTSHSAGELWLMEGIFGFFVDRDDLRNIWQPLVATLPANRGMMASAVVGNKGYLIGGTPNGASAVSTIYEFDFTTETFTNCGAGAALPCATAWPNLVAGAAAASVDNLVYVIGGTTDGGYNGSLQDVRTFNTGDYSVSAPLTSYPHYRHSMTAVLLGNKIYAMGGVARNGTPDCSGVYVGCTNNYAFDLTGSNWGSALTQVSHAFSNGTMVAYGNFIYTFGGAANPSNEINSTGQYNTGTNTWDNCGGGCGTLSQARFDLRAVVFENKAYLIGGVNSSSTAFNIVEEFDLDAQTFTNCDGGCTGLQVARGSGAALLYNDKIYYFGGLSGPSTYTNTVFKYVP